MANLRNNTGAPAAAQTGETEQEVRDRWSGEIAAPMPWPLPGPAGMGGSWNEGASASGSMGMMGRPMGQRPGNQPMPPQMGGMGSNSRPTGLEMSRDGQSPQTDGLDMSHLLPDEEIESPTTMNEAYLGSLKAMLTQNKGNYIVATFLVGTQNTVSWEGILYEVGNDYVTIYQPGRDRYIVSDMYSLRYMEFYDIERRDLCNRLLREQGWQGNNW